MLLRLGTPGAQRGVAHLAQFCGYDARWSSVCNQIDVSTPVEGGVHGQWHEKPTWRHRDGRDVYLTWDSELPRDVPICRDCVRRRMWQHDELLRLLTEHER